MSSSLTRTVFLTLSLLVVLTSTFMSFSLAQTLNSLPALSSKVMDRVPKRFLPFAATPTMITTAIPSPREPSGNHGDVPNVPVPFYRYFDQSTGDHFYTTDAAEMNNGKRSYTFQKAVGKIYKATKSGTVPLFLYYDTDTLHHYYTTNSNQFGGEKNSQEFQGIAGYVFDTAEDDTLPLHRFHNGATGDNFYTTNLADLTTLPGYKFEAIEAYIYPVNYVEFAVDLERIVATEILDAQWTLHESRVMKTVVEMVGHILDNFRTNVTQEVIDNLKTHSEIPCGSSPTSNSDETTHKTLDTSSTDNGQTQVPSSEHNCECNGPDDGVCVKVFQHPNYAGASTCVYLKRSPNFLECENLSEWWQDRASTTARVSSIKSVEPCIRLHSELNCLGDHVDIEPGNVAEANLFFSSFDDQTRSVGLCTPSNADAAVVVTTSAPVEPQFQQFKTEQFGHSNYTVVLEPKLSWNDAKTACEKAGLVLAGVETLAVKNFLIKLLADAGVGYDYWGSMVYTGGLRTGDRLSWIENENAEPIQKFFWSAGEPNHLGGLENCMVLWLHQVGRGEAGGNDSLCDLQHPFICKTKNNY